ncbi:hypothetical protein E2P81_ATG07314 [Venturia nashicola]|uniref:Uncharacterized protein n=1 Tax=Venturia nashicola TaxID=86259 RepID=A0A4Z1NYV8_9PEZI|nr:hypothetical protein E6O75_ATG07472 [Venturia nashicola]TLD31824.1 hypothetical protein E2P81_ATG07314 [Venturia nashicola]
MAAFWAVPMNWWLCADIWNISSDSHASNLFCLDLKLSTLTDTMVPSNDEIRLSSGTEALTVNTISPVGFDGPWRLWFPDCRHFNLHHLSVPISRNPRRLKQLEQHRLLVTFRARMMIYSSVVVSHIPSRHQALR